jgi:dynactin complex subunit
LKKLLSYELFLEARLSDITTIIGNSNIINNVDHNDVDFIKFKTINKRINNKKIRLSIKWNHTLKHNLIDRLYNRTNIKSISELNEIISKGLDELFLYNSEYITESNRYSLWFSEYNISIIIDLDNEMDNINIITILNGNCTQNVKNIIELKSTL